MGVQATLSQVYMESHPESAAALLERFPAEAVAAALAAATPSVAASVLGHLAPGAASACLTRLQPDAASDRLQLLPIHVTSAILRRVPDGYREPILAALPGRISEPIGRLLRYPEGTAGALLDPLVMALPLDATASDALDGVRAFPERVDHEIFVIDREQTLVGSIPLRVLVAAPGADRLGTMAVPILASFSALSPVSSVIASAAWADTHTVPVVDRRGLFLGALRYDSVLRLASGDARTPMSTASVSTLVSLSELCWTGCAGLLSELTAAAARHPQASRDAHGA